MSCESCSSENRAEFGAEMNIHFPGREGPDKPVVWVFPKLLVCMDCGFTEFAIPETELAELATGIRKSEPSRRLDSAKDVTLSNRRASNPHGGGSETKG